MMDLLSRVYTLNWVSTIRGELQILYQSQSPILAALLTPDGGEVAVDY
jgi:hypothetical protein